MKTEDIKRRRVEQIVVKQMGSGEGLYAVGNPEGVHWTRFRRAGKDTAPAHMASTLESQSKPGDSRSSCSGRRWRRSEPLPALTISYELTNTTTELQDSCDFWSARNRGPKP